MPQKYPKRAKSTKNGKIVQAYIGKVEGQMFEKEEQKERLRRVLESRKAEAANDQETVQSATKDNTNAISNDATKAKQIRRL